MEELQRVESSLAIDYQGFYKGFVGKNQLQPELLGRVNPSIGRNCDGDRMNTCYADCVEMEQEGKDDNKNSRADRFSRR